MGAVLVASLLGAFGRGPLASAAAESPAGTLRVDYERIVRRSSSTFLHLSAARVLVRDGVLAVRVNRQFLEAIELGGVVPEPLSVASAGDHLVYEFGATPGDREVHAVFEFKPLGLGRQGVEVAAAGSERVNFSQFVLP